MQSRACQAWRCVGYGPTIWQQAAPMPLGKVNRSLTRSPSPLPSEGSKLSCARFDAMATSAAQEAFHVWSPILDEECWILVAAARELRVLW